MGRSRQNVIYVSLNQLNRSKRPVGIWGHVWCLFGLVNWPSVKWAPFIISPPIKPFNYQRIKKVLCCAIYYEWNSAVRLWKFCPASELCRVALKWCKPASALLWPCILGSGKYRWRQDILTGMRVSASFTLRSKNVYRLVSLGVADMCAHSSD